MNEERYKKIIKHRAYLISKEFPTASSDTHWSMAKTEYNGDKVRLSVLIDRMGDIELQDLRNEIDFKRSHDK